MKPRNPLLKKATSLNLPGDGVGGIDVNVRDNAENAGDPRVETPMVESTDGTSHNPFAEKGTEPKFACAKCSAKFPDGDGLANHAEETGHDPIEQEIDDATFFKESENFIDPLNEGGDPFQNALQALEELAANTDSDDIRECCKMTVEDLKYFHGQGGGQPKEAATQSFGTIAPLGTNPPAPPKPPVTPAVKDKQPAAAGKPMTQEQADALNLLSQQASKREATAQFHADLKKALGQDKEAAVAPAQAVEMHETPPVGAPREDARRHIDQSVQQEIKDSVDKPVQHRIGSVEPKIGDEVTLYRSKYKGQKGTVINIMPTSHGTNVYLVEINGAPADHGFVKEDFDPNYQPSPEEAAKAKVMQDIIGKTSTEVEESATSPCPNCAGSNHNVVDEENGEKLIECSDCGSFFTI